MLEEAVKNAHLMSKQAVIEFTKQELIQAVVHQRLPRKWELIRERLTELEKTPEGKRFVFIFVDFVLWLNGMKQQYSPIPPRTVYKEPLTLIKLLSYTHYILKMRGEIVELHPSKNGEKSTFNRTLAEAIVRQSALKGMTVKVFLTYEGKSCQLMWVDEDGKASIEREGGFYRIDSLKEMVERR